MRGIEEGRRWLKAETWDREIETDQGRGIPAPPLQKPPPEDARFFDLVPPERITLGAIPLREAIARRRSHRKFSSEPLTLEELSFLLWATQGVREVARGGVASFRTVPSAGARHPFETYLSVHRVEGLPSGLYRYLPLDHRLVLLREDPELPAKISRAALGQKFVGEAAAVFVWAAIPYRTEWRYSIRSHKVIAIDAGHICQNLYLACEAIGAGTCAVGAYSQAAMDGLLEVDGDEEFVIYLAPVGKLP
ncbi:MAG: Nitroreductase [Acetothermia bacterium 64_32]|nr:MAG: Nitroreductase [Acetothermia bacterium 64_32]MBC7098824.1 SagB/ThcOx family dehydrogenase [Candidatus Bipolaricaulota bacterium]HAF71003.1 nitroreductase [Candidatus Acetothermia bacterium]